MKITAIVGEACRYYVDSESGDGIHLVDLLEGACGCASYTCNHRRYERETGNRFRCKHLRAVREAFLDDVIDAMKEHALSH
jgi:hypothetical protein